MFLVFHPELGLLESQVGLGHERPGKDRAQGDVQAQSERPVLVPEIHGILQGLTAAGRDDPDDLARQGVVVLIDDLRSRDARAPQRSLQAQIGRRLVPGVAEVEPARFHAHPGRLEIGTVLISFAESPVEIHVRLGNRRRIGRDDVEGGGPRILRLEVHQGFQEVLAVADHGLRLENIRFPGGDVGLSRQDFDGGQGAGFDLGFVFFQELPGQFQGLPPDLQVFPAVHEIPISAFRPVDVFLHRLAEVVFGHVAVVPGQDELPAAHFPAEILEKRLGKIEPEGAAEARVDGLELPGGIRFIADEAHGEGSPGRKNLGKLGGVIILQRGDGRPGGVQE